jgi:hypothetical protein
MQDLKPLEILVNQLVAIGLNAAIIAVTAETPRVLTVKRAEHSLAEKLDWSGLGINETVRPDAIPFGPFDASSDRTLELGLRRWVREQAGLELGYVEQLYTFGDRNRDPAECEGGPRVISIAYLALIREDKPSGTAGADWRDCYQFLPWEDWRDGRPAVIQDYIAPALNQWVCSAPNQRSREERQERGDIHFGLEGAPWVPERVLERYELIYEIELAIEALRDRAARLSNSGSSRERISRNSPQAKQNLGRPMALDHRRILATALGRLRGKLKYRPVIFELLPSAFTLLQLQRVVEALAGVRLHKQNLRRLVETGGLVEGTGQLELQTGGRPAELFRFRRNVLRERPAPGVGIPGFRQSI